MMSMRHGRALAVALAAAALCAAPALATAAQAAPPRVAPLTQSVGAIPEGHQASIIAVPKFIFHAGLAFGAFHHFIYLPFKAGKFTSGSIFSKLKSYLVAGGAGLFVYHETKLALAVAQQNKVLKVLVSPLTTVVAAFGTLVAKIKSHSLDSGTISSAEKSVTEIQAEAKSAGSPITDIIPSASQLAGGA